MLRGGSQIEARTIAATARRRTGQHEESEAYREGYEAHELRNARKAGRATRLGRRTQGGEAGSYRRNLAPTPRVKTGSLYTVARFLCWRGRKGVYAPFIYALH